MVSEKLDAANAWTGCLTWNRGMDGAKNCLLAMPNVANLSGWGKSRRVCPLQIITSGAGCAAPWRTYQPPRMPNRCIGWSSILQTTKERSVAVTHDKVLSWIMSPLEILELDRGEGIPWKEIFSWLDQKQKPLESKERENWIQASTKTLERELNGFEWLRKPRQAKGKARWVAYWQISRGKKSKKRAKLELIYPPDHDFGAKVIEVNGVSKALWR